MNGNPLYVSAGLGMSGLPFRFLNLPEVISIQCVPASGVASSERLVGPDRSACAMPLAAKFRCGIFAFVPTYSRVAVSATFSADQPLHGRVL